MSAARETDKLVIGCSAVACALCFLPWFKFSFAGDSAMGNMFRQMNAASGSSNAFDFTEGVFAFLFAVGAVGLVIADHANLLGNWDRKLARLAPFLSCVASVICMLIFLSRGGGGEMMGISAGRTPWFFLALVAMGTAAFFALSRPETGTGTDDSVDSVE